MRRFLVIPVGLFVVGSAAVVATRPAPDAGAQRPASAASSFDERARGLPPPRRPGFLIGGPRLLDRAETVSRWAPVSREVAVRLGPSAAAPAITSLGTDTPEATTNLVLVLEERRAGGALWTHVRVPILPNNTTGWVPRSALGGYRFVHTRLVVDVRRLTATLLEDGEPVFAAPVGVGQDLWPTPRGEFYVRSRLAGFDDPFYGPVAFGTSARSAVLTDWPSGGFIGIHGTNEPELIPGRVSHGCIRLRNDDILRLSGLMPVGTPVTIR